MVQPWCIQSVVGGGFGNSINSTDGFIGGGRVNQINSQFSGILGGRYNTIPAGFNSSFIVRSNIVLGGGTGYAGALHVNSLWMDPTTLPTFPGFPAPFAPGTVFVDTTLGAGKPLRIV